MSEDLISPVRLRIHCRNHLHRFCISRDDRSIGKRKSSIVPNFKVEWRKENETNVIYSREKKP